MHLELCRIEGLAALWVILCFVLFFFISQFVCTSTSPAITTGLFWEWEESHRDYKKAASRGKWINLQRSFKLESLPNLQSLYSLLLYFRSHKVLSAHITLSSSLGCLIYMTPTMRHGSKIANPRNPNSFSFSYNI
jgi:hypothetical protein